MLIRGLMLVVFYLALGNGAQCQILPKRTEAAELQKQASELARQGKLAEAVVLAERALAALEGALPARNPLIPAGLMTLADLYKRQGNLDAADAALNRALTLRRENLPLAHSDIVETRNLIAALRDRQNKPEQAEALYKDTIEELDRAYPKGREATARTLGNLAVLYERQSKLASAIAALERAVSIFGAVMPEWHPTVPQSLAHLAKLCLQFNRLPDAQKSLEKALTIRLAVLPKGHPQLAETYRGLANVYRRRGQTTEAEAALRSAAENESSNYQPRFAELGKQMEKASSAASQHSMRGEWAEALAVHRQLLTVARERNGEGTEVTAAAIGSIAVSLEMLGRHPEAEPLRERSLEIFVKAKGVSDSTTLGAQQALARVRAKLGRPTDEKQKLLELIEQLEAKFGKDCIELWWPLLHLAVAYGASGDAGQAIAAHERRLAIARKAHGPYHHLVILAHESLAKEYARLGRHEQGLASLKQVLDINAQVYGAESSQVAAQLTQLALLYMEQNQFAEAEPLLQRYVSINQKEFGNDSRSAVNAIGLLATQYDREGRRTGQRALTDKAEALFKDAIQRAQQLPSSDLVSQAASLASLYSNQQNWDALLALSRETLVRLISEAQSVTDVSAARGEFDVQTRLELIAGWFIHAAWQSATQHQDRMSQLGADAFAAAQWAHTGSAAAALSQMSSRFAKQDNKLAKVIRARQDAAADWYAQDKLLLSLASEASALTRDRHRDTKDRLAALEKTMKDLDQQIAADFPDYAALASPKPLELGEVRSLLREDEMLVFFSIRAPQSMVWVISKDDLYWYPIFATVHDLSEKVAAIRCGLDAAAWDEPLAPGRKRCADRLGADAAPEWDALGRLIKLPRFDMARSHELYKLLLRGRVADATAKGKHLMIVPSGPLTTLPFQVLINKAPGRDTTYESAEWLARASAVSIVPTLASLKALLQTGASKAAQPYIGFGNPLLVGPDHNNRSAWQRQTCASAGSTQLALRRVPVRAAMGKLFRGGLAKVEEVRAQEPLPETVDELCAVARATGADQSSVYLGQEATESKVKELSRQGVLAQAKVLHFATHGLLAGETRALADKGEPALILTPPQEATEENDGLLTASEIAQLKLDADWVLLSACNTAGGDSEVPDTEALSGLARAFFYAGARAVLVSHWAVNSDATVQLITKMFGELRANARFGRAEALRRSMQALIQQGQGYAHPANWAPFVVVGEGAR